jgi:RHH-type rel operon transcriptional repressor/antitoxin RelB
MGVIMATDTDTTVQFRINSAIKEGAFSVFHEMGISPSEAMRVFITQVYRTRTLPLVISAESENEANSIPETGYAEWLRSRLQNTITKLDSGEIKSYSTETAKAVLHSRLEERRKKLNLPA